VNTYELLRAADALIHACEGLEPEAMDSALAAWVDGATDKAAALQAVVARAESEELFLDGEAKSLARAAKQQATIAARCRTLIVALLRKRVEIGEGSVIRGPGWSLSLRQTEAVEVSDPTAIPPAYLRTRTTTEPDKAAIKEAVEAGETIPGASLVTRYSATIRKAQ